MSKIKTLEKGDILRTAPRSKVDQTVLHLIEGIHAGQYAPGQRLVESDLTEELGISRGPLREAFKILATKDMLELTPNRGVRIKRLERDDLHQRFTLLETLGNLAIEGYLLPKATDRSAHSSPETDENITAKQGLTVLSHVVNYYCQLARSNQNGLLADYIYKLNLTYFSPHILRSLDVNTTLLESQFAKMKSAILSADTKTALQAHRDWCQDILKATYLLPA